jgi:hypothetical protein
MRGSGGWFTIRTPRFALQVTNSTQEEEKNDLFHSYTRSLLLLATKKGRRAVSQDWNEAV